MEVYVACFDISDDGLRTRAGKVLLRYGDRVQKSVFEIAVRDRSELDAIRRELVEIVEDDDIPVARGIPGAVVESNGAGRPVTDRLRYNFLPETMSQLRPRSRVTENTDHPRRRFTRCLTTTPRISATLRWSATPAPERPPS